MAEIVVKDSLMQLQTGASLIPLSADEVYSTVFEGRTDIRGVNVDKDMFLATGLQFSSFPADPVVLLESCTESSIPACNCRFIARAEGVDVDAACHDGRIVDYAVGAGRWVPLPQGTSEAARAFLDKVGISGFGQISLSQYLRILRYSDAALYVDDRTGHALDASRVAPELQGAIPVGFVGSLYPYQLDGYRWLSFVCKAGLGGIIADEMGLGKTVQVACLLQEAKQLSRGPNLVVLPATLIENWRRELAKFAPQLRVLVHSGPRRTGLSSDLLLHDVVISSFETAVVDISMFRNVKWDLLIVDEAQGIKNPAAKRSIQLRTIQRRCTIAVTGTPVENRLTDLWAITDFVVPSLLGSLSEFERRHPDTVEGAAALEPVVSPMMLRRRVADVAGDLPDRIDIPQALELDETSVEAYEMLRSNAAKDPGATLATLIGLRMFCAHPWLVNQLTQMSDAAACSVKFDRLLQIMDEIVSSGGKAIVFTSYQHAIDLIRNEISDRFGVHCDFIDGRVPVAERQGKVDVFSACKGAAALVLNPRAAGTGLNITAANHVIHYNLEWNPAIEDQASARAYRRGQKQIVTVHRLFYVNTVEDVIDARMQRKRALAERAVVGTDGRDADVQDILRSLRISPVGEVNGG